MIKAIVFDMGGVVIPLNLQRCIDNFKTRAGFNDIENYLNAYHQMGFIGDLEEGKIDEDEFYRECLKHCAPTASAETVNECFQSLLDGINPDALRLFRELKDTYPLYVLSNNNPLSMRAFDELIKKEGMTVEDIFRDTFFSYRLHMLKPSREFFLYTIEHIGVKSEEILFIDDSETNILAARAVGLQTLLYDSSRHNLYQEVMKLLSRFSPGVKPLSSTH